MFAQNMFKRIAMVASTTLLMSASAWAANPTLKIGFVGVTSGPAAAWGISNQRSMGLRQRRRRCVC